MPRILVIDDDADLRDLIRYDLAAAGYQVSLAGDGLQGLASQRALPADVVVTDIFMPEKEGIETIRELRQEFPGVQVIAITGGSATGRSPTSQALGVVTQELGVVAVLQKPFNSSQLLESVEIALARR